MAQASSTDQSAPRFTRDAARNATATGPADFRIDAPDLPKPIADAALSSGGFPYDKTMKGARYSEDLQALQIELLKLLSWVKDSGQRVVLILEGRDAAGKDGAISRLTEHLNPRSVPIVALPKPTERETAQWYFQRYVAHLPAKGEIAIFDRSWYNRAGVEPVFGFCTPGETEQFLAEAPVFESLLARDGIQIIKFFLSIGRAMQMKRLHERWHDPLNRWKLSDIDYQAIPKWSAYSAAFETMLRRTDTAESPWTVIRANDKKRARLEIIRHVLDRLPYTDKDRTAVGTPDPKIAQAAATFLGSGGEEK